MYNTVMSGGFLRENAQSETFLPFFVSTLESDLDVIEKDYPERDKIFFFRKKKSANDVNEEFTKELHSYARILYCIYSIISSLSIGMI